MIVITDSNVIFSALVNPKGSNAEIFYAKSNIQFTAPAYLIFEIKNHFNKIVSFSGRSKKELKKEFDLILSKIIDIDSIPKKSLLEATRISTNIDIDDTFFVAISLYKHHKIWTGDRKLINGLKAKGYDICITTTELKAKLYKK